MLKYSPILKSILFVLAIVLSIATRAAHLSADAAPAATTSAPSVITLTCGNDFPPYIYLDPDNQPRGIYVDYFNEVTTRTGQKFRWLLLPWPKAVAALESGEADALAGFTPTPERATRFDFSTTVHTIDTYIFFNKNLPGINKLEDLRGYPVGMAENSWPIDLVRQRVPSAKIIAYPDGAAVAQAAAEGKIQVFIESEHLGAYRLTQLGAFNHFLRSQTPIDSMVNTIGVRKGDIQLLQRLNACLAAMPPNEFQRLEHATLGSPIWSPANTRLLLLVLALALAVVFAVFLWNWTLRRKVRMVAARLRASEQRFRDIFESSTDAIVIHDRRTGAILDANQTTLDMYGITRDRIATAKVSDFSADLPEFSQEIANRKLREADETGHCQFEWLARRKDGSLFPTDVILKTSDIGGASCIIAVVRDITARKHADAERQTLLQREQQARLQAELASAAKDRFIANLSHELRTPLTPVLMTLSAWKDEKILDESHRAELEILLRNVQLESHLIDDLLDVTRIAQGKLVLERTTCDLNRLVRETLEMFPTSEGAPISVSLPTTPIMLHADPIRLRQILWNLVGNARKFTSARGQITVTVKTHAGSAEVAVHDTGIGIPQAQLPELFTPFVQGTNDGIRPQGLGLGLPISLAIAQAHNGTLTAYSPGPSQGATFTLRLPLPN